MTRLIRLTGRLFAILRNERRHMGRHSVDINIRFWSAVKKGGPDDCWLWTRTPAGGKLKYGRISYNGRVEQATHVSWILANGPIPDGVEVCHTCDNSLCVNPKHLWLGSHLENIKDMYSKGRNDLQKLTERDVRVIRILLEEGFMQARIAKVFHVTAANISYIKTGDLWEHLE